MVNQPYFVKHSVNSIQDVRGWDITSTFSVWYLNIYLGKELRGGGGGGEDKL